MKNYSKPVSIVAKIIEILMFIGSIGLLVGIICSFFYPELLAPFEGQLEVLGLTIENMENATPDAVRFGLFYGVIGLALYGMIARNIHLIAKSLVKRNEFCEDNTPFTPDTVRMVREIGIFTISISLSAAVFSWILFLFAPGLEVVVNTDGIMMGLVVLYLSTIFNYGVHLQQDVEGLV